MSLITSVLESSDATGLPANAFCASATLRADTIMTSDWDTPAQQCKKIRRIKGLDGVECFGVSAAIGVTGRLSLLPVAESELRPLFNGGPVHADALEDVLRRGLEECGLAIRERMVRLADTDYYRIVVVGAVRGVELAGSKIRLFHAVIGGDGSLTHFTISNERPLVDHLIVGAGENYVRGYFEGQGGAKPATDKTVNECMFNAMEAGRLVPCIAATRGFDAIVIETNGKIVETTEYVEGA